MDDRIMDDAQRLTYTLDRKLALDTEQQRAQLDTLTRITLANGFKENELSEQGIITDAHEAFLPPKSAEQHFFNAETGELVAYNPRGTIRFTRDRNQAEVLKGAIAGQGRELIINERHRNNDVGSPQEWFKKMAIRLVRDVFSHLPKAEVRKQSGIDIVMSPHNALLVTDGEVLYDSSEDSAHNDYLKYRILDVDGRKVINFDYIFADQAHDVLRSSLSAVNAYYPGMDVNVYHCGRVGLLRGDLHVEDNIVIAPNGAVNADEIEYKSEAHRIRNHFALNGDVSERFAENVGAAVHHGITYNTNSILNQTRQELLQAKDANATSIDMEAYLITVQFAGIKSLLTDLGAINYHLAYVPSDEPLLKKTLADTAFPHERLERVGTGILANIRQR